MDFNALVSMDTPAQSVKFLMILVRQSRARTEANASLVIPGTHTSASVYTVGRETTAKRPLTYASRILVTMVEPVASDRVGTNSSAYVRTDGVDQRVRCRHPTLVNRVLVRTTAVVALVLHGTATSALASTDGLTRNAKHLLIHVIPVHARTVDYALKERRSTILHARASMRGVDPHAKNHPIHAIRIHVATVALAMSVPMLIHTSASAKDCGPDLPANRSCLLLRHLKLMRYARGRNRQTLLPKTESSSHQPEHMRIASTPVNRSMDVTASIGFHPFSRAHCS
jgi:hypothetical protein